MPSWKELKRFCERDGWELYKNTDHYYYRKYDDNGDLKKPKFQKEPATFTDICGKKF